MKYVDMNGIPGTLAVGENPVGVGFASITMTYEDIADPHFIPWFFESIHCRFVNVVPTH